MRENSLQNYFSKPLFYNQASAESYPQVCTTNEASHEEEPNVLNTKIFITERQESGLKNRPKEVEEDLSVTSGKSMSNPLADIPLSTRQKGKDKDRSRQDVINKSLLRMVRRFYHRIFIRENKKLVRRLFQLFGL